MELHQLRYFCGVARAGNFTRKAGEILRRPARNAALAEQLRRYAQTRLVGLD